MSTRIDEQNMQNYLKLVMHGHNCFKREQQAINTNDKNVCTVPHCGTMRNVLGHMTQCYDLYNCPFPNCRRSRFVIHHWRNCTTHNCLICNPFRKASTMAWIVKSLLNIYRVDNRVLTSVKYAKMKEIAETIENDAFSMAINRDDYSKRAMDLVATIQKAYETKRLLEKQPSSTDIKVAKPSVSPTVFSVDDIRKKMTPILQNLYKQKEGPWFREPVTEAIAPGYFKIIKHPMDFSTMFKKLDENQYTTPFQFCEDMWLVFNNTWTYNKKTTAVYKAAQELATLFMTEVDPIMKDYGYCCGRQYVFLPPTMLCHTTDCRIRRDGDYFVYKNLSGETYTFCKKCFDSVKSDYMLVGDDSAQTLVELPKVVFQQAKNDHQEPEAMIDCTVCARRFHTICVLYHEHLWPQGYVCQTCTGSCNVKRKENHNLARELPTTDLSDRLEKRANDFINNKCGFGTGRVTIRILAANDRVCEVKPRFKKHFGSQIPDGYPYRTKAIFVFQEIEGVDVVLFGMHVQEYDSRCPGPNSKRVYISYIDSVNYFRPKDRRTEFYHEILIGYLEYVKQLGFTYAHIWACPPKKGDDYIFYCHPETQRLPGPERLQEWYKEMFETAKARGIVFDYKNIEDYAEKHIRSVMDIPYFDDDHWPKIIEDLLTEFEEPIESSGKRKLNADSIPSTKKFKKTTTSGYEIVSKTNLDNILLDKIKLDMKHRTKSVFILRLCDDSLIHSATLTDPNPLIHCDLIESRDALLNFAHDNHCEFSTLRRAKYSTMFLLMKVQSLIADEISYTCDVCNRPCNVRYHCKTREDYDLCTDCYTKVKHEPSETFISIDTIHHAVLCQNANCTRCKWLIEHTRKCTKRPRKECLYCMKLFTYIWTHAKTCTDQSCRLPYCTTFKRQIQQQQHQGMQVMH